MDIGQVLFVVWRESFEALLVISIIYAWIKCHPDARNGMKFLWGGVSLGVIASVLLALLIYGVFNFLDDASQSLFMILMEMLACILIVQTVYWMNNKHGISMKSKIESEIKCNIEHHNWWGVALIIVIVIAREGSEIVVFLSSFIMSLTSTNASKFFMEVAGGVLVAILTLYIFLLTSRFMSWRIFFKVTGVVLLFLALSLLLKAVEESLNLLIQFDFFIPEFLIYPAWNTVALLDDSGVTGNFISSFFAYRSQPAWLSVITFIIYWIVVSTLFVWNKKRA